MRISEVTKDDLAKVKALQDLLRASEIKVSPVDCARVADLLFWFRDLGAVMGKVYQEAKVEPPPDTGLKIREYSPGADAHHAPTKKGK